MTTIYTVSTESLIYQAEQIEIDAEQSLRAWIILGQCDKYSVAMARARTLRAAAGTRSIHTRREILRNAGYIIKSPKTLIGA
ncbi:hypothetical protein UFOVP254_49 [uncultured Caudovirales phage]|uniref:Uncharacterized protein n=1 Tax=uncultured Caudovirales phage TaxID=2100421 RepID=A0A6J5KZE6_9CAUD|nr:hypothetical protein UFOVP76_4 [uncultured Caudovirales phage]CAB4133118.1 hypothetical protein UFOVP254_49 [uncultured Caudovirales phage]